MIGTIELERLTLSCIVGILPHERVTEQEIFLDLAMELDFAPAAASEDVHETVDYVEAAKLATELCRERRFQLVETMAEELAAALLERWEAVQRVRVAVHKPAAVPQARDTVVRVERQR